MNPVINEIIAQMETFDAALFRFLLAAFSVDELGRLLRWNYPAETNGLLPVGPVTPAVYFSAAVTAINIGGCVGPRLFDLLRRERPRRKDEIDALEAMVKR